MTTKVARKLGNRICGICGKPGGDLGFGSFMALYGIKADKAHVKCVAKLKKTPPLNKRLTVSVYGRQEAQEGAHPETRFVRCGRCDGEGFESELTRHPGNWGEPAYWSERVIGRCPACNGTGEEEIAVEPVTDDDIADLEEALREREIGRRENFGGWQE